jgi:hypothetical protein
LIHTWLIRQAKEFLDPPFHLNGLDHIEPAAGHIRAPISHIIEATNLLDETNGLVLTNLPSLTDEVEQRSTYLLNQGNVERSGKRDAVRTAMKIEDRG